MKYFKLSLVTLSILISGCGGGDSSSSSPSSEDTHEAKTVAQAEKNLYALSSLNIEDLPLNSIAGSDSKALNKVVKQKENSVNCQNGGTRTLAISEDTGMFNYTFNNCKNDSTVIDGKMSMTQLSEDIEKLTFKNFSVKEIGIKQYLNLTMTIKDASDESWSTIDGTIVVESQCATGTYKLETIERLVDTTDGSNHIESGILKLNGATYIFENPYVTIQAGSDEQTMTQYELDKHIITSCFI